MVRFRILLSVVLSLGMSVSYAVAQTPSGTIGGRVTDPQGAVVGSSDVTVTNESTNVSHAIKTNNDGLYTVPLLPPGSYSISVTTPNFKKELRSGVVLQIGQSLDLSFQLTVGSANETVSVTSEEPLTATESAAVGTVIDNQKVVEIPLNGRQFYNLAVLVPGVMPPVQNSGLSFRGGFNVAGQIETANYATLDGFNDMDAGVSAPSVRPSIDDIQEFKIYSGTFEAEFGHAVGGQLVVTTKSGTNSYHGNVYEFIRNQMFDAVNYFTAKGFKPSLKRNQFGGTFGGPLKRDKVFFFLNYEGLRFRNQFTAQSTVPNSTLLGGNFTSAAPLKTPTGYDPRVVQGNIINPQYMTPAQLQAYTVGKALLAFYPTIATGGANNYTFSAVNSENSNQYALHLDATVNASNSVYATLNYFNDPTTTPNNPLCSGALIPGFGCYVGLTTQLYGGGWTHIFTPNVINTLRGGYQRLVQPRISLDAAVPFDNTYGIPAFFDPSVPDNQGVPFTNITGYATYGGPTNLPQNRGDNTYDYGDTLLYNHGAHTMKAGVEYTRTLANALIVNSGRGQFVFQGTYTGNPLADSLLGLPTTSSRAPTAPVYHARYSYLAGFAQDTWKITRRLTVNYGLRWETFTPVTDKNGLIVSFNLTTQTTIQPGVNGQPAHVYHAYNNAWGPRLGLNYRPFNTDSTVVHSGFGITYDAPIVLNGFTGLLTAYPLRLSQTFQGTAAAPLSFPNPYAGNGQPSIAPQGINPNFKPPMNIAYSLGVQQQLSKSTVMDLSYQGSESSYLTDAVNINEARTPQATNAAGIAARPYSAYSTVTYTQPFSHSSYNALYAKLEERMTNGLTFLAAYTWSKSLDNATNSPQDYYNLSAEKGLSAFDVRHRFVASPVYRLPFGRGGRYWTDGKTAQIIGGWELAANIALQTGTPVTPVLGANLSNNGKTTGDRPNVIGNPNNGPKSVAPGSTWANVKAFALPTASTYGNAPRGSIASPAYRNADLNVARTFTLPHEMDLQFRAEFFNVFNHPNFGLPNVTFGTTSFGTISSALDPRDTQFALKLNF
jgi:Carboxypeptidase regulatory-like domain